MRLNLPDLEEMGAKNLRSLDDCYVMYEFSRRIFSILNFKKNASFEGMRRFWVCVV